MIEVESKEIFASNAARYDRYEDMAHMGELNEACVLDNLKQRYQSNLIYSFSGLFLVAVNPYRNIPIYEDETVRWYRGQKRQDRPPHIFSVADGAYQALMTSRKSQSILITGESGAGKTENTKRVIHYLTAISSKNSANPVDSSLEQQLILTNPILESFGNAQTVRNNNSSRFGKFIRIDFDPSGGHIVGASIEKYLLEKSRVTHRAASERNFHIFYQLLQGAPSELLVELKLMKGERRPTTKDFAYICNSNSVIPGVDDSVDFQALQESFNIVGIDDGEAKEFFRVLAVILLLGNLKLTQDDQGQAHIPTSEDSLLNDICVLLGVDINSFKSALLNPVIRAGKEVVTQAREKEQVQRSIEALSRSLYERLFDRLVGRLNNLLFSNNTNTNTNASTSTNPCQNKSSTGTFIGVLDIAGFEIFEINSFEQLLINYTNEKLQQFFNHHMFIVEQEEYARQGITWNFVDFGLDSQPMIDLLERTSPVGILPCLDEDCVLPRASDKSFTSKVQQLCISQNTGKFEFDKLKADKGFILNHYAGKVEYSTEGWVEKNKDPLNENVTRLLAGTSEHLSVQELFIEYGERKLNNNNNNHGHGHVRAGIFRTVAQKHRESLGQLMNQLGSTQPHFVRCILPNSQKQPGLFVDRQVLEQLQCNGVLEGIRICRQGYPNRLLYNDFWRLYSLLGNVKDAKGQGAVTKFLSDLMGWKVEEDFALGQEKIFFRAGRLGRLDVMRDGQLSESLRQLQANCRGALLRGERDRKSREADSIKILQSTLRPFLSVRRNIWSRLIGRVRPLLTVTRSENRIKEIQAQMVAIEEEREQQTSQLRQALKEERETLTTLQNQLGESERNRRNLQIKFQEGQDLISQLSQKQENLQIELNSFKALSSQLKTEISLKGEEGEFLKIKISELENEKFLLQESFKKIKKEFEEKMEENEKILVEKRGKEEEIEGKIEMIKSEKEKLLIELGSCEERIKELKEDSKLKEEEHEQMLRDHRGQIRNLQANEEKRRGELEEEIDNLKRKSTRDLESLKLELESEKKSVSSLKEAIKAYETGSSQAEAEKTRSQQAYKRERERLEIKIKDLNRMQEESVEREEALIEELKHRQDAQRLLKLRLQELEDFQGDTKQLSKSTEMKLNSLNDQIRDLTGERNQLRQKLNEFQFEREAIQGQLEETEDSYLALQEQLKCTETIRSVLEGELSSSKSLCSRLTAERDSLQAELLAKRSKNGGYEESESSRLEEVIEQLERDSLDRQSLLRENRRLERELRDTLVALTERDQSLLQDRESISRTELKARKLQTALEDSEAQISELERIKRRLTMELAEGQERAERLQRDFERMRSIQRQQFSSLANSPTVNENSAASLHSLGRELSCSSITSKLTETTINE